MAIINIKSSSKDIFLKILSYKDMSQKHYKLLWIEGVGTVPNVGEFNNITMLDLEEIVNNSPVGIKLPYDTLLKIINSLDYIVDLIVVCDMSDDRLKDVDKTNFDKGRVEVSIEFVDSGFWEIITNDILLINELKSI